MRDVDPYGVEPHGVDPDAAEVAGGGTGGAAGGGGAAGAGTTPGSATPGDATPGDAGAGDVAAPGRLPETPEERDVREVVAEAEETVERAGEEVAAEARAERAVAAQEEDRAERADRDELRRVAAELLQRNWTGTHTVPASGLYPHQWSWDSAFIAVGLRHVAPERAQAELERLLAAQWADGRVPQIVYDPAHPDDYEPGESFWRSRSLPGAPEVPTSGLVQPPNHAWAALLVHKAAPQLSRERGFLERVYPRLVAWHRYLAARRDHRGAGLASVIHPWESGTDDSPLWDEALAAVPVGPTTTARRPDLAHVRPGERPGEREYAQYYRLAERYRDHGCDDDDPDHPFVLEDPAFNALWAVSELALAEMAEELGRDPGPHRARSARIAAALEHLYVPELGLYGAHDVFRDTLVRRVVVNGLVPLIVPGLDRAEQLVATVRGPGFLGGGALMVPSYDLRAADVDLARYWRGPAWFNMNWLLVVGLHEHLEGPLADGLADQLMLLARRHDFPEYVDPMTGEPHGARDFSWTAALALDLAVAEPVR
ncbi:MGH1-like glycoside hydrolase domain-containing protein [Georgenia sp. AZ-5]|uniref:MGH1-like glycoside hydrolase domain-containing protein n=1 Tax=Georgenia sp. AZ-5 TaxID=3367526 RepID=UPI003754DBD0